MRSARGVGIGVLGIASLTIAMTASCTADDPLLGSPSSPTADSGSAVTSDGGSSARDGGGLAPDASPPLGCPLNCLPSAPSGWTGPSAVYDGAFAEAPADCPAQYTRPEVTAKRDITDPGATCACGSPTFSGASCAFATTTFTDPSCMNNPTAATRGSGTCFQHGAQSVKVTSSSLATSGTCAFPTPVATIPAPAPGTATKACGLPQTASCSAERPDCTATPIPSSPYTRLCIHKAGDEACPTADYGVRLVSYTDLTDDRACSACTGTAGGGTCPTVFGWSGSQFCEMAAGQQRAIGAGCFAVEASRLVLFNPTGMTCTVGTPSVASGAVVPTGPVTFCCAK